MPRLTQMNVLINYALNIIILIADMYQNVYPSKINFLKQLNNFMDLRQILFFFFNS